MASGLSGPAPCSTLRPKPPLRGCSRCFASWRCSFLRSSWPGIARAVVRSAFSGCRFRDDLVVRALQHASFRCLSVWLMRHSAKRTDRKTAAARGATADGQPTRRLRAGSVTAVYVLRWAPRFGYSRRDLALSCFHRPTQTSSRSACGSHRYPHRANRTCGSEGARSDQAGSRARKTSRSARGSSVCSPRAIRSTPSICGPAARMRRF